MFEVCSGKRYKTHITTASAALDFPVSVGMRASWLLVLGAAAISQITKVQELLSSKAGTGGRRQREAANHKVHFCHTSGPAKLKNFPEFTFSKQNSIEPREPKAAPQQSHAVKTMTATWMKMSQWQCWVCCLGLAMFPQFPGPHWSLWWIKVCGGTQKERERDRYPADSDLWAILRDNCMKRRRKRGSAQSIVVCNSKVWTSFIVKQGNVGNSRGNRFFNYLFDFNKDFQILLFLLL